MQPLKRSAIAKLLGDNTRLRVDEGSHPALIVCGRRTIYVERLIAEGVPFATARGSRMNKLVWAWLNERAKKTQDARKSRRKQVTSDAVRELLKQVEKHRQHSSTINRTPPD